MIEVEGLRKEYGEFVAVDEVSFAIEPGEIFGLLGHNGAGKTTIFRVDDTGSTLTSVADLSDGAVHVGEPYNPSPPSPGDPAIDAFAKQSPVSVEDAAAVPILYDEATLGAVTVTGLLAAASSRRIDPTSLLDALWRIVSDGAVVLNNAQLSADMESGDFNVDDLLNVDI